MAEPVHAGTDGRASGYGNDDARSGQHEGTAALMARLKIGQKPALDDMTAGVVAPRWEETDSDAERVFPA
jgi:hypothetical protein